MKTVLIELIEKLQELEDNVPYAMEREVIKHCKNLAIDSLEKEKQQIIEACNAGLSGIPRSAEKYYSETFS